MLLKIGELAKRTGLTVRALRHYDDIDLLVPSVRSDSGYRMYDRHDVAKLYRIQALRRLDISLLEIQQILAAGVANLQDVVTQQIAFLDRQIEQASALRNHLIDLQDKLGTQHEPGIDDWLATLEHMVVGTKYFTDDELRKLKTQRSADTRAIEPEKTRLAATLHSLIERGISPSSMEAQTMAHRWIELLLEDVGGDEALLIKFYTMHWNEPALHTLTGIDQNGMTYISHAMAYRRLEIYAKYCHVDEIEPLRENYVAQAAAWPPLIAAIRDQMAQSIPPENEEIQHLARQWLALSRAKTGGDVNLQLKFQKAFENEPSLRLGSGIDASLLAYIDDAIRALQSSKRSDNLGHAEQ